MRSFMSLSITACLVAAAPAASAQNLRVSVERAFGFSYASNTASVSTMALGATVTRESTSSQTSFNLFGAGFSSGAVAATSLALAPTPPRFAVDYELSNKLTVGAAAYFAWTSYAAEGSSANLSAVGFGLAPRVGLTLNLGDRVSFWPRAGLTFGYTSASPLSVGATSTSASYLTLSLNLEPTLVYMPATHFGVTAMVFGDIPLVGNVTSKSTTTVGATTTETTTESTFKQLVFGLQFGVLGRF